MIAACGNYVYVSNGNMKKIEQTPRMGITIASIAKKNGFAGFFGKIKAAIANMLIKPLKVDKLGNATMLEFGEALFQKKTRSPFRRLKILRKAR